MPAPAPTPDALPLAAGPNGRPDPLTPRRLPWRKVPDSTAGPQTHLGGERARCLQVLAPGVTARWAVISVTKRAGLCFLAPIKRANTGWDAGPLGSRPLSLQSLAHSLSMTLTRLTGLTAPKVQEIASRFSIFLKSMNFEGFRYGNAHSPTYFQLGIDQNANSGPQTGS